MPNSQIEDWLEELALSQGEAARLLSVTPRTVRRWVERPAEIPGSAKQALRAWIRLQKLGFPWRPDALDLGNISPDEVAKQIALNRAEQIELSEVLKKVEARGGPAAPWEVDLKNRQATLGPIGVSFYALPNGGFSPSYYHRSDVEADVVRDQSLLQDAYACIANAIAEADKDWYKSGSR